MKQHQVVMEPVPTNGVESLEEDMAPPEHIRLSIVSKQRLGLWDAAQTSSVRAALAEARKEWGAATQLNTETMRLEREVLDIDAQLPGAEAAMWALEGLEGEEVRKLELAALVLSILRNSRWQSQFNKDMQNRIGNTLEAKKHAKEEAKWLTDMFELGRLYPQAKAKMAELDRRSTQE